MTSRVEVRCERNATGDVRWEVIRLWSVAVGVRKVLRMAAFREEQHARDYRWLAEQHDIGA